MHPFYSFFNADVNLLLYYSSIPAANLSEGRIIPSEQSSKLQVKFSTKKPFQNPTSQPFSQPDSTAVAKSNSMSWLKALEYLTGIFSRSSLFQQIFVFRIDSSGYLA